MTSKIKLSNRLLSVLLCLTLIMSYLPMTALIASAAGYTYKGGAGTKVSDLDTSTKYSESLGDNASTEYAGRIWTDKSVYTDDVIFETFGGGTSEIKINQDKNGEDFLVAYSTLATAQSVSGETKAPIDVVFVIDISGSMSNNESNMDNGYSRIYNTVQAVNSAITKLMGMNNYTRVGVVAFSNQYQVLLPLDRYTKVNANTNYFSLSKNTAAAYVGSGRNQQLEAIYLYTDAVNSKNETIDKTTQVSGGTNIQMGMYGGLNMLATEQNITANIGGSQIKRIPSMIILSDGSPTYSSSTSNWWTPSNNNNDGPGNGAYVGNGMKALMTGAYMKQQVDAHYGVSGTNYSTSIYTVGMGITNLPNYESSWGGSYYTGEKDLANITLNPEDYWSANNDMAEAVVDAWETYTTNNGNPKLNVNSNDTFTFNHPNANDIDSNADALKKLVTEYYAADNASAVTTVFDSIVSNISISVPQIPTEIKGTDPMTDGYITFTDPIGEYMEVKDVKAIIYAGTTFTKKTSSVNGNAVTYVFEGTVDSAVYGNQDIKDIVITVSKDTNGNETLVIKIPASVIPLRVNTVQLNSDGTVKTHTNNGAYPARVIYSVGLQDKILKESDDGVIYVDRSKLSAEYLAKNTTADGNINFYSNLYKGDNEVNGSTAGNATAEFEPAHTNDFYYIQSDMPIYKDKELKNQVTVNEGLDDATKYYYKDEYYHGSAVEVDAIERTGAQLKRTEIVEGTDGYLYRAEGSPRLNRILKFEGTKVKNATGTAEDFYAPEFHHAEGSTNAYDGKFIVYQGNNGKISVVGGGNLEISKTVNAATGLTAPDKEFEFTIDLDGSDVNQGEYDYIIVNAKGETVKTGTVSKNSPKITLKDGQTATVLSLPPKTVYTVTEAKVDGFVVEANGASGTIEANKTSVASFINTYNVEPVSFPTSGNLTGQKELAGREWSANDSFAFFISPYNNAPLPVNYNENTGVTVNKPDTEGGQLASFNFGTIEFTKPGTYRYTIAEKEPENDAYLPGISYSRALYRLVVNVVDNGNGTLKVESYDIQKLYDDDANQLFTYNSDNEIVMNSGEEAQDAIKFTNTYSASAVTRVPVAFKEYTDNSGMKPLVSGMFEFKLEALGIVENNALVPNSASKAPMPEGSVNGAIITTNEGHNVTFPSVTFTQDVIPEGASTVTFRYQMSEVIPTNKVNGMTYDTSKYTIDVVVSIDANSHILDVDAIYPNNESVAVFKNEYTPISVKTDIDGNKTLNGRDMKSGESFEFGIMGANAATNNAVRNGVVVIPSASATVKDGKNGIASAFSFENIEFKKAGTYVFAVTETKGNSPSVKYDEGAVNVTVVIDDENDDGFLEVKSVTYSNGKSAAEFVNTYTSKFNDVAVSLSGSKNLTGKTLLKGEFYFNVAEYYNGEFVTEGLVTHTEDTVADNNGAYIGEIALLDGITYDKAGTYEYYITEQIPNPKVGGTTYDESQFRYTVVVTDDLNGNLKVTSKSLQKLNGNVWENAEKVAFSNKYEPKPTTVGLPLIKKVISGDRSKALQAGEFKFILSKLSATPADGMILPTVTEVTNAANGDVVFDEIKFTKAGDYKVSVKEVIPEDSEKIAGITYSTRVIVATYTVVDDRNGTLTATLTGYDGDTFVNEYKAEPNEITIDIKKNFTGRDNNKWLNTDKFDFEIVILDPDTKTSIENGEIEFPLDNGNTEIAQKSIDSNTPNKTVSGKIKVNKPGTYKFIVREIAGDIPGIHYDSQPREITVIATDNSETAKIDTVVKVNGTETNDLTLTFNNVYDAGSTEISGHDHLTVEKIFKGRADNAWLDTDAFKFTLEAYESETISAVANGDVELPASTELTVTNANKAHPHFGNIIFHKTGTYKFKVTELDNNIKGVTYDADRERIVIVEVTDNNVELIASIASNSEKLTFTNTYSATSVTLEGKTNLKFTKSLVGRNWFSDDKFTFVIEPSNASAKNAVDAGDIIMPADTELDITAPNGGYEGDVASYFGDITFKKAGSYIFAISEKTGSIDNIDYDSHTYFVLVEVTDNNEGALVVKVTYHNESVFVNTYTPDSVTARVEGKKKLEGNRQLTAGDFEFALNAVTVGAPLPENTKVANKADGAVDFGKIEYTEAGTYVYEIRETKGSIKGVTYDTNKVTATVTVSYDKVTGKLSTSVAYTKEGEQGSDTSFTFKNVYKADASEPIAITAKKKVTPSEGNSFTLKGGEFSFIIEGSKNAPAVSNNTVKNDADGNIDFGTVKFTEAGTFSYTIREVQANLGGFTYDSEVYTITVKVTDDIDEAKLKTSVTVTNSNDKEVNSIVFDNKYEPEETSALIFGVKELDSEHKLIEADEFEFTIKALTENAPMPSAATVKNEATGVFQFDTVTYKKVGTYKYEITEKNLGEKGYTYDDKTYTVTVTVTDEGKGELKATVDGVGTATAPAIKFVNKYVPESVDVVLGAKGELAKKLDGRELNKEEFIFAVLDGDDNEITTAKNNKDGEFEFTLSFTKADTYNYTIVEKNNGLGGVTYDENTYSVKIVIADKGGYLEAESVVYTLEGKDVEEVVFNNTYKADETEVIISAVKKLIGRNLEDGEFKFVLKDENGKVVLTATNGKNGKITFEELVFTKAGTYKYTVSEEKGTNERITYDKTEYVVEIEVIDEGKGELFAKEPVIKKADSKDTVSEIVFENSYTAPTPPELPQTGDTSNIWMWFAVLFISSSGLICTTVCRKKKKYAHAK